ncbi:MAG: FkbM family methyltransferase [Lentilitoribacter sp.]|uniref:FkbM family methyltransferase n=2 Tax=Alphaproteobacteria TaxID=28211 RepID=UPI003266298F
MTIKRTIGERSPLFQKLLFSYRKRFQPAVIRMEHGIRLAVPNSLPEEMRKSLYKEQHELPELELILACLEPGDKVLEIGSGVGMIATTCASICGAENVTCYEPNPSTRDVIQRNFDLNGLEVDLRSRALATQKGTIDFYFSDNIVSSSLIDQDFGGKTEVACDDIRDVIEELQPTAIVMDVEGAEIDLLPTATLSGVSKILVEMHPGIVGPEKVEELHACLERQGLHYRRDLCRSKVAYFER